MPAWLAGWLECWRGNTVRVAVLLPFLCAQPVTRSALLLSSFRPRCCCRPPSPLPWRAAAWTRCPAAAARRSRTASRSPSASACRPCRSAYLAGAAPVAAVAWGSIHLAPAGSRWNRALHARHLKCCRCCRLTLPPPPNPATLNAGRRHWPLHGGAHHRRPRQHPAGQVQRGPRGAGA